MSKLTDHYMRAHYNYFYVYLKVYHHYTYKMQSPLSVTFAADASTQYHHHHHCPLHQQCAYRVLSSCQTVSILRPGSDVIPI